MKVYIIHRDVPYEFGEVLAVLGSRILAEERLEKFAIEPRTEIGFRGQLCIFEPYDREDLSIEEWEVEE